MAPVHRFAAVAGSVTARAGGKSVPVRGASVWIASAPPHFQLTLELREQQFGRRWRSMSERLDRTVTGAGGHFHFMDLPNGDYEIRVTATGAEEEAVVPVHISRHRNEVKPPERADVVLRMKQEFAPAPAPPVSDKPRPGRRRTGER